MSKWQPWVLLKTLKKKSTEKLYMLLCHLNLLVKKLGFIQKHIYVSEKSRSCIRLLLYNAKYYVYITKLLILAQLYSLCK